jgi:plasmid stabilization system protein ParE
MKYKIRINPVVISDVQEIKAYIAEDNPQAAARMGNTIYSKIKKLADFPKMGTSISSKINTQTDYRFLVCGVYLIFRASAQSCLAFGNAKGGTSPTCLKSSA